MKKVNGEWVEVDLSPEDMQIIETQMEVMDHWQQFVIAQSKVWDMADMMRLQGLEIRQFAN